MKKDGKRKGAIQGTGRGGEERRESSQRPSAFSILIIRNLPGPVRPWEERARCTTQQRTVMFEPIRGGTRGGQAEFKWADVSADKDREVCVFPNVVSSS